MGFMITKVVPWGRSFEEYVSMFSLSADDLAKKILGCGDGPACFNADLTKRNGTVISVDPIYQFSSDEIRSQIGATYNEVMKQIRDNQQDFIWENIKSVEELGRLRMEAMEKFLKDYPTGGERYIRAELPTLPFEQGYFDIALSSHFLFLYSDQLSYEFHLQSIQELCRVANEARIFPLLEFGAKKSRHIDRVINDLTQMGYQCNVEKVSYEFQKGANEMLRVRSPLHR